MQIVLNSSPLIFLAKLGYLNQFVESPDNFYSPQSVADEIGAKLDPASCYQEIEQRWQNQH